MKLIYFPGFGGNQNSDTFKNILENYPDSEFIIYDNINAEKAHNEIQNQLEKFKNISNQTFIGQSLGGFWAEYFALKLNKKLILINPSLQPFNSLKKYNLTSIELENFEKFQQVELTKNEISIILSKNDLIVDSTPVRKKYNEITDFIYVDGGHKFTDFRILKSEIEKLNS